MYDRFSDRARMVMQLANQETQRFKHEAIGTKSILWGLIQAPDSAAGLVLRNLDLTLEAARTDVRRVLEQPKPPENPDGIDFYRTSIQIIPQAGRKFFGQLPRIQFALSPAAAIRR